MLLVFILIYPPPAHCHGRWLFKVISDSGWIWMVVRCPVCKATVCCCNLLCLFVGLVLFSLYVPFSFSNILFPSFSLSRTSHQISTVSVCSVLLVPQMYTYCLVNRCCHSLSTMWCTASAFFQTLKPLENPCSHKPFHAMIETCDSSHAFQQRLQNFGHPQTNSTFCWPLKCLVQGN